MSGGTLSDAIVALRRKKGSHDKLVAELKEAGMPRASRQLVINWENGSVPGQAYRAALVKVGLPESELNGLAAKEAAGRQRLERRLGELATKLGDVIEQQKKDRQQIGRLQARIRKLEDQREVDAAAAMDPR